MDKSEEIVAVLKEVRDLLRDGRQSQLEALEFLRANAERSKAVIDRSVGLQEISLQRQKRVMAIVLPLIVFCLLVVGFLIFKLFVR